MKKMIQKISKATLVLGLSMMAINGFAQGMYGSVRVGYNFPSGAQTLSTNTTTTATTDISEPVDISLGQGVNVAATFGYSLSDNIAAELGVNYLLSSAQTAIDNDETRPRIRTEEYAGTMIQINPALVFSIPMDGSLQPYAKVGAVLGIGSTKYTFTNDDISNNNLDIEEWKFSGGLGLGFNTGFGAYYSLNDKMKLFGELNITSLTYAPTKGELITATSNGADQLPGLDTIDKEIIFVDRVDNNANIPNASPDEALKMKLPYGSVGINVGINISF